MKMLWRKPDSWRARILGAIFLCAFSGCSGNKPAPTKESAHGEPTLTVNRSLADSQRIAVRALGEMSCDIKRNEPTYIRAKFGSGEIVKIHLWSISPQSTGLHIDCDTTYIGGAWQHNRKNDVIWAIKREVDSTPS